MSQGARNSWVFTYNNYTEPRLVQLVQMFQQKSKGVNKFEAAFGKEIGESGTPHLQGVVWGTDSYKFRWSYFKNSAIHFDPREQTKFSAWAYCVKGKQTHREWVEHGIKGPNWHEGFDGFDNTCYKEQLPALLAERLEPEKPYEIPPCPRWMEKPKEWFKRIVCKQIEDWRRVDKWAAKECKKYDIEHKPTWPCRRTAIIVL